jgi:hypothetical protein
MKNQLIKSGDGFEDEITVFDNTGKKLIDIMDQFTLNRISWSNRKNRSR